MSTQKNPDRSGFSAFQLRHLTGVALIGALPLQVVGFLLHPPSEELRHVTQATYNLNGRDLRVNPHVNKSYTRDLLCTTWEKTDQRRGSSGSSDGWGIKFMLPVFALWRRTLPNVTVCRS